MYVRSMYAYVRIRVDDWLRPEVDNKLSIDDSLLLFASAYRAAKTALP